MISTNNRLRVDVAARIYWRAFLSCRQIFACGRRFPMGVLGYPVRPYVPVKQLKSYER
jgi:hypothetical protein